MRAQVLQLRIYDFASPEYAQEVALRSAVLREPLGLRFTPEELAQDEHQIHIGAFSGAEMVGCLLLVMQENRQVKMRQVAVRESAQGQGVGRQLVAFAEAYAGGRDASCIVLHARETVVEFYERQGYQAIGETFIEVTLPHRKMLKHLPTIP